MNRSHWRNFHDKLTISMFISMTMPYKRASPTYSNDILKTFNPHLGEILKSFYKLHLNYYLSIRPQHNLLSKYPFYRITPYHNPRVAFTPINYALSPINNTIIFNRLHSPNIPNLHNLYSRLPFPHHRSSLQIQHRYIHPPSHPHYRTLSPPRLFPPKPTHQPYPPPPHQAPTQAYRIYNRRTTQLLRRSRKILNRLSRFTRRVRLYRNAR